MVDSPAVAIALVAAVLVGCSDTSTTTTTTTPTVTATTSPVTTNPGFGTTNKIRLGFGYGDDTATAVAIQSDGKIVLAGGGSIVPGMAGTVVRLQQDGTLDLSFGERGKAPVPLLDGMSAMIIDSSGRFIIADTAQSLTGFDPDFAAVRLNSDGSLDTSFGDRGKAVIPIGPGFYDVPSSLALQTDGKIVLAGQGMVGTVGGFVAARLNSDGTLDQGFGSSGVVAVALAGGAKGVAIDASGRIVMAGSAFGGSHSNFVFVRLTSDGAPDLTFGADGSGIVTIPVSGGAGDGLANAVTIDSSGHIVAAGYAITSSWDFAAIRLNDDGALDNSFGSGGLSVVAGFGLSMFNALTVDANGKIVLAGDGNLNNTTPPLPVVVRLNGDGSMDTSFGLGRNLIAPRAWDIAGAAALALDVTGRPVVAGYDGANKDFAAWRFNLDASPDTSFGTGGEVLVDVGNEQSQARALSQLADGKFLVAGFTAESGRFAVAKLNSDGTFDPSFGTYGKTAFSLGTGWERDYANGMTVAASGQVLLAGWSNIGSLNYFSVARVSADGTVDTSFGSGGKTIININGDDRAFAVAVDSVGGIIVAGSTTFAGTHIAVVRLGADGVLDTSFGTGGKVIIPTPMQGDYFGANSMAIDATGKIIVVGASNSDFGIARLNSNGTFDTSFGNNGLLAISVGSGSAYARTVQFDANGNMLIAGVSGSSNGTLAVVRLRPNDTLDASFGSNGIAKLAFGGIWYHDDIHALAIDPLGRILVAGTASPVCCYGDFAAARLLSSGALDTAFGANGIVTSSVGENDDIAYAMALQPDGKIVLAGNGSYSFGLVRIDDSP